MNTRLFCSLIITYNKNREFIFYLILFNFLSSFRLTTLKGFIPRSLDQRSSWKFVVVSVENLLKKSCIERLIFYCGNGDK